MPKELRDPRPPMVYLLHSGNLFGTERMALETLAGFPDYLPVVICPPGPLTAHTRARGIETWVATNRLDLLRAIFALLRRHKQLAMLSTALTHVLCITVLNMVFQRKLKHLHLVHGGADERSSYGRKKLLNPLDVTQVAVSAFVRERLIHHGVRPAKIQVIGNFLSTSTQNGIPRHAAFTAPLRGRGVVVSRLIPDKRVHLLCEAMERDPQLRGIEIDVFGVGGQLEPLAARAQAGGLPLHFRGFAENVQQRLHDYDFLVHLNSEEPFGMVLLEAMAAGIPVLVPDRGGTGDIVTHNHNGFSFAADDAASLAASLKYMLGLEASALQRIVAQADRCLSETYAMDRQVAAYRRLLS